MNLLGKEIELRHIYTITMPKPSVVPEEGRTQIHQLVARAVENDRFSPKQNVRLPYFSLLDFMPNYFEDSAWEWVIARGEYAGTLPKRISSIVYKKAGFNLPPEIMSEIGNIARKYTVGESLYHFDFTDQFDWEAGDFGDSGSCFWGGRAGARVMIQNAGGLALRFYTNATGERGFARCWLLPIPRKEAIIAFNIYGLNGNGITVPRILSEFLGVPYKGQTVKFLNNGSDDNTLYINGAAGWLVGSGSQDWTGTVDLHLHDEDAHTCVACGDGCGEDYEWDGDYYCEDCYKDRFQRCEWCEDRFYPDDLTEVNGNLYCERCLSRHFTCCDRCGEYEANDETHTTSDGSSICNGCYSNHYFTCDKCAEIYPDDEQHEVYTGSGRYAETWCDDCFNEEGFECEDCGRKFATSHLAGERDGQQYCDHCGLPEEESDEEVEVPARV